MKAALRPLSPWLVPELRLWLLPPEAPWWHATEPEALGMPYWAFAWPGGQVLARFLFDHPEWVRGRRVLDFGCGGALEGVAAAKLGAASVLCADLDAEACALAQRNAELNGVQLEVTTAELLRAPAGAFDVILAGDVCYSVELAAQVLPWLRGSTAEVLVGDPLRVPGALGDAARLATYAASFDGDPRGLTLWPTHVLRLGAAHTARPASSS